MLPRVESPTRRVPEAAACEGRNPWIRLSRLDPPRRGGGKRRHAARGHVSAMVPSAPAGAEIIINSTYPRVALRFTRGYSPLPRWGKATHTVAGARRYTLVR